MFYLFTPTSEPILFLSTAPRIRLRLDIRKGESLELVGVLVADEAVSMLDA
ncbi:MAG: hypothetical protein QXU11_01270 [Thermoproteota archaeon]